MIDQMVGETAAFYVRRSEIPGDGLKKYDPFAVVLCGGECGPDDVATVVAKLPDKEVGAYVLTSDLSAETAAKYPGDISRYVSTGDPFVRYGVGTENPLYHVGMLSQETVDWTVERVKSRLGGAKILIFDCWSPKNCDWKPGVDFTGDGRADTFAAVAANWREWTVKTVAALHEQFPDVYLVPNVGHSCNPSMAAEPLRTLYRDFDAHCSGIGVEGDQLSPAGWSGPYRRPRRSILFTNSLAGFAKAQGAIDLPGVLPAVRSWLLPN